MSVAGCGRADEWVVGGRGRGGGRAEGGARRTSGCVAGWRGGWVWEGGREARVVDGLAEKLGV